MGKAGKERKRRKFETSVIDEEDEDDLADTQMASTTFLYLAGHESLLRSKEFKQFRAKIFPLVERQSKKYFERENLQHSTLDDIFVSERYLDNATRVVAHYLSDLHSFDIPENKPFRKAFHQVVHLLTQNSICQAPTIDHSHGSICSRMTNSLRLREWEVTLQLVKELVESSEVPKLGALQRWVRDCDVVLGFIDCNNNCSSNNSNDTNQSNSNKSSSLTVIPTSTKLAVVDEANSMRLYLHLMDGMVRMIMGKSKLQWMRDVVTYPSMINMSNEDTTVKEYIQLLPCTAQQCPCICRNPYFRPPTVASLGSGAQLTDHEVTAIQQATIGRITLPFATSKHVLTDKEGTCLGANDACIEAISTTGRRYFWTDQHQQHEEAVRASQCHTHDYNIATTTTSFSSGDSEDSSAEAILWSERLLNPEVVRVIEHIRGADRRPANVNDMLIFTNIPKNKNLSDNCTTNDKSDQTAQPPQVVLFEADNTDDDSDNNTANHLQHPHPHCHGRPAVVRYDCPPVPGAFMLTDVLSQRECLQLLTAAETIGYSADAIEGIDNLIWLVDDIIMSTIFNRIEHLLPKSMNNCPLTGINTRFRFFRYQKSAVFRPHIDGAWPCSGINTEGKYCEDISNHQYSKLTFVLYLNGGFDGGGTTFFVPREGLEGCTDAIAVEPSVGCVMCFPHGDADGSLVHEGSAVVSGVKYIVRTEVLYATDSSNNSTQHILN